MYSKTTLQTVIIHEQNLFRIGVSHPIHYLYKSSCETPPFQYCNHVNDCDVPCSTESRNPESTVIRTYIVFPM